MSTGKEVDKPLHRLNYLTSQCAIIESDGYAGDEVLWTVLMDAVPLSLCNKIADYIEEHFDEIDAEIERMAHCLSTIETAENLGIEILGVGRTEGGGYRLRLRYPQAFECEELEESLLAQWHAIQRYLRLYRETSAQR